MVLRLLSWLDIQRQRMIEEWEKVPRPLFSGDIPKDEEESEMRFICDKLSGGPCELQGKHCAMRHMLAKARHTKKEKGSDALIFFEDRDDQTCATCPGGSKRAELLGIVVKSWRGRFLAEQRKRYSQSKSKRKREREEK